MVRSIGKDVVTIQQEARAAETMRRLREVVDAYRAGYLEWRETGRLSVLEGAHRALEEFDGWEAGRKKKENGDV